MNDVPFTSNQLGAVDISDRDLDTCVVAGPGSGKTTVLVEYFRRLVEDGVDPLRILAITFTEKAAGNMRKRLNEVFHQNTGTCARLERAWVSTLDGFCARLLRENSVVAGVDPEFAVADERESWRLAQASIAAAVTAVFEEHPAAMRALIRGLSSADFAQALVSAYDAVRGAAMTLEALAAKQPPIGATFDEVENTIVALRDDPLAGWKPEQRLQRNLMVKEAEAIMEAHTPADALRALDRYSGNLRKLKQATRGYSLAERLRDLLKELPYTLITEQYRRERELLVEVLRRFDLIYRKRKQQAGVLDFADLEEHAVRLLEESPQTRARVEAQFDHVVMDEFQDTNGQQARLLDLVRRPGRFYAVGDINQSIYGFRHAEPEVFRQYRDQAGRRIELTDNFRSRKEILRAVQTVAKHAAGIEPHRLIAGRSFEQPRSVCVEAIAAGGLSLEEAVGNEARLVARRILELTEETGSRFAFQDMAVLVRNTEVLSSFADAFDEAGIPYVVNRGKGFYEAREVNDLTHLLRTIANPRDEISLAVVLRSPLAQVSDEALLELRILGENMGTSLVGLSHDARPQFEAEDFSKLSRFRDLLHGWRIRREHVSFDRLLLAALDDCGYPCEPGARGWTNIEKFLAQARRAAARMSLDEFVEELALVRASNPREPDAPPERSANAVNVMTVHSAKGLEFPIVFVSALHKGVDTNLPVVAFSRRFGLGARWRNPATGEDKDDLFQHAIRSERKKQEDAESDRLLYVAMTRAEQHLVLSFSHAGRKLGNWAKGVVNSLDLNLDSPRDEVLTRTAPDGQEWKLRLLVADQPPLGLAGQVLVPAPEPVERVALPAATGQQDTKATVTAIAAFAKCPREYYLRHYLGLEGRARKLEAAGELSAADFGTQVHALLAGSLVSNPDPEALRLADVFRQGPLGRRAERAKRVEREFDFLMAVDDVVLRGQVDLWFEEGGELVIVDYKTDAVTPLEAHQRAGDYALQLRLYAMAVERVTGRTPDRAWLDFLRPNTVIEVDLAPSLVDVPEHVVHDFQQAQARLEFPLVEAAHCHRCAFFHDLCPSAYR